jgi:hypothetical protein
MECNSIQSKIKTIQNKKGIKFNKINKNVYNISFVMENNNCVLSSLVNFDLINLIYKLNSDVYECIETEKINEDETNIILVLKKIFFDFIPQKYAYLNVKKSISNNIITFSSVVIKDRKPKGINESLESINIETILNTFEIVNDHKIIFDCNLVFNNVTPVPAIFDTLFANLINKMFLRFKQFIEVLTTH